MTATDVAGESISLHCRSRYRGLALHRASQHATDKVLAQYDVDNEGRHGGSVHLPPARRGRRRLFHTEQPHQPKSPTRQQPPATNVTAFIFFSIGALFLAVNQRSVKELSKIALRFQNVEFRVL